MQPPKSSEDDKEEVPSKSQIDIKDFDKVEIKAATVIDAENVPKSDKLLKIQVDLGARTTSDCFRYCEILSFRRYYWQKVAVVTNLKPAKLMGHKSEGMILSAEKDKVLTLVSLPSAIPNGAIIK